MTQGIEAGVGAVWQAKQTAAGTIEPIAAAGMRRLRKPGEDGLKAAKTYGNEPYVDGRTWGSPTSYVSDIGGEVGSITSQGQIETTAWMWAQLLGVDVVTGASDPYTHTMSSGVPTPVSQTIYQTVGVAVGPVRQAWFDAKIAKLKHDCGREQQVMHLTEDLLALVAAQFCTAVPSTADSGTDPWRWDEAISKINDITLPEISGESIEADSQIGVYRGQSPAPICFTFSQGQITSTMSSIVTDGTLPVIYKALYGTATPGANAPVSNQVEYAKLETVYTRSANRTLTITRPKVEVKVDDLVLAAKAGGGVIEVAFGGTCKEGTAGAAALQIVAKTGDANSYVA